MRDNHIQGQVSGVKKLVSQNFQQQISADLDVSIKRIQEISGKFINDLAQSNEPWQYVVRAHAYVDISLGHAIQISLKNQTAIKNNEFQSMNFPLKLSLIEGLGIITSEEKSVYLRFNNVRNLYSHNPIAIPSLNDEMKIYDTMPKHLRENLIGNLKKKGITENDVVETYKKLRQEISKTKDDDSTIDISNFKPQFLKEISVMLLGFIWGKVMAKELEGSIAKALRPGIDKLVENIQKK